MEKTPSPNDRTPANYARDAISTARYSQDAVAQMRRAVQLMYARPTDAELKALVGALDQIQGHVVRPGQYGYLIRLYQIHGPATYDLLWDTYTERGTTENLLLAVELAPPAWRTTADRTAASTVVTVDETDAADEGAVPRWVCPLGPDHVPAEHADGSVYCATCDA